VQPSVGVDYNVDVNIHVITDEEDCKEASDEVSQNNQDSNEEARSDGNVGDNSVYTLVHKYKLQIWLREIYI
jgi:hypothetical protein